MPDWLIYFIHVTLHEDYTAAGVFGKIIVGGVIGVTLYFLYLLLPQAIRDIIRVMFTLLSFVLFVFLCVKLIKFMWHL